MYVELGDDTTEALYEQLESKVKEAETNVISIQGSLKPRSLFGKFRIVFRIRLVISDPSKIRPMKIELHPKKKPVK